MIKRQRVSVEGISTAFLDEGSGDAIVALHGIPTSSALFEPLLPYLSDHRLIAPDLIGQGDSETPANGPLGYAAYKQHLDSFLATVPLHEFSLIVHDLGGVLGLEWAADHPERVRSIIILSTTVTWSFRVGFLLYAANLLGGEALLRWGLSRTLKSRKKLEASLITKWAAPWTRRRILRGMDHFAPAHLRRLRSKLSNIHSPALLIWGGEDDIFPPSHAHQIVARLPHSNVVTIPRCGHWSPLDASEAVARHIVDFLKSGRTGTA